MGLSNKLTIDKINNEINKLNIHQTNLSNEYLKYEKEIDKLNLLRNRSLINIKTTSKEEGVHDIHYYHTLFLELPCGNLRKCGYDSLHFNLEEIDIKTLYENKEYYNIFEIKKYLNKNSIERLNLYFKYKKLSEKEG